MGRLAAVRGGGGGALVIQLKFNQNTLFHLSTPDWGREAGLTRLHHIFPGGGGGGGILMRKGDWMMGKGGEGRVERRRGIRQV